MAKNATTTTKAPPAPPATPTGRKLDSSFGPGTLKPGAGKLVQRTQTPAYCGAIFGRAFGYTEHPNAKDPTRTSTRFAGQFIGIRADGTMLNSAEAYLPSSIQNAIRAALDVQRGTSGSGAIEFSVEVWCEPDEEGRQATPLGYRYVTYDRKPQVENDPLMALGIASGLIEPSQCQLAPPTPDDVDPETGEVRQAS